MSNRRCMILGGMLWVGLGIGCADDSPVTPGEESASYVRAADGSYLLEVTAVTGETLRYYRHTPEGDWFKMEVYVEVDGEQRFLGDINMERWKGCPKYERCYHKVDGKWQRISPLGG
jgi:hypothetical protein